MPNRILVLEDETLVALDLKLGLEDAGMSVAGPFERPGDALEHLRQELPDAALLDGDLGGETSAEVATALAGRGVPFFYLTARDERFMRNLPPGPVIHKPFDFAALLTVVRSALS